MDNEPKYYYREDEISLRDVLLKIRDYVQEVLSRWKWFIPVGVVVFGIMLYNYFTHEVKYEGELTFMVDEGEGAAGAQSSLLSQIGIPGKGAYNLDRILELSKSRRIISDALFGKIDVEGREDYVANFFIDDFELHEKWKDEGEPLSSFYFTHHKRDSFNRIENYVLKSLVRRLGGPEGGQGIYTTSIIDGTGIMKMSVATGMEELSITFLDTLYVALRDFYIGNAVEKDLNNYRIIEGKVDSIYRALTSVEYQIADFKDRSRSVYLSKEGELKINRLQRQLLQLQAVYIEAVERMERLDFSVKSKTPFIQLIDQPLPPLSSDQPSIVSMLIRSTLLTLLLGIGVIVARKIYYDIMDENG